MSEFYLNSIFLISVSEILGTYLIVVIILYFIPTVIGFNTRSAIGIFLLNLLLGWTFVGWIGALIWALSAGNNKRAERRHNDLLDTLQETSKHDIYKSDIQNSYKPSELKDEGALILKLTQLYDLKEKKVITEEIYESERLKLIAQFPKNETVVSEENKLASKLNIENELKSESVEEIDEYEYSAAYDEIFKKQSFFTSKKIALTLLFTGVITSALIYFIKSKNKNDNSEIELNTNITKKQANEMTLILEENKRIKLSKYPLDDDDGNSNKEVRDASIRCLVDLNGDKKQELVTTYFTGGAHCCYVSDIFIKVDENTYKNIFKYDGEIIIRKNTISLYIYEDLGYFLSCYGCGIDIENFNRLSPEITLSYKNEKFEYAEENDTLYNALEKNMQFLKLRGVPRKIDAYDDEENDDGTRKEYALNIISYFFNSERNIEKTKSIFFKYYESSDKEKIWNAIEEYITLKQEDLNKKIFKK